MPQEAETDEIQCMTRVVGNWLVPLSNLAERKLRLRKIVIHPMNNLEQSQPYVGNWKKVLDAPSQRNERFWKGQGEVQSKSGVKTEKREEGEGISTKQQALEAPTMSEPTTSPGPQKARWKLEWGGEMELLGCCS